MTRRTLSIVAVLLGGSGLAAAQAQVSPPPAAPVPSGRYNRTAPMGFPSASGAPSAPSSPTPPPTPTPSPTPPPAAGGTPPSATNEPLLPGEREAIQPCKKLPPGKRFKLTLRGEVDTTALIAWMSATFCRPFVVPGTLRQSKVTILAPDEMSPQEAYRVALSSLESMGLTVQPEGKVLKVIESNRARESAIPIYGSEPPSQDQFVTRLLRLEHVAPDDVKGVLDRLRGRDGDITPYAPTNTLVITDLATNIRRMEEVVHQLDVPMGGEKIWLIKLHSISASDMANMLQTIFGVGKPGQPQTRGRFAAGQPGTPSGNPAGSTLGPDISVSQIIPDDRTNSIIIVAMEKAYQRILALVKRLDLQSQLPGDPTSDRVHVIPLENADADTVGQTLAGVGATVSRGGGAGVAGRPPTPPSTGNVPHQPGQGGGLFEGDVRIASDKPTNSLVVLASGRDYITVRDLIKKLDIPRRQVFVEATILEISVDKARSLGLAWHGGYTLGSGDSQSLIFGGSQGDAKGQFGDVNSILFSPGALSGLGTGLRGPPIPNASTTLGLGPGISIPSFGVFVQMLQTNGDVNVVSMPHLLTTDNEKATIQVGQNLPFPGSLGGFPGFGGAGAGGAGTPGASFGFGTSVQRQDVALKLDITPHVNDSDFVRLEIDNEISDVVSENFNGLGPATSKRTLKSTVTVRDQQSIVLGGLLKDRITETTEKVPLLGDIPILGYLFKRTRKTVLKQNLLIILTPYVIKDPNDLRRIFERKVRERREFMERFSAFQDERDYDAEVDYRRKRGLLEEINRTAVEAEMEAGEVRAAEAALRSREAEGEITVPWIPPPPRSRLPMPPGAPPLPPPAPTSTLPAPPSTPAPAPATPETNAPAPVPPPPAGTP